MTTIIYSRYVIRHAGGGHTREQVDLRRALPPARQLRPRLRRADRRRTCPSPARSRRRCRAASSATARTRRAATSPHWFLGNGMLHGVRLENGRAVWYRNRYVRTPALDSEGAGAIREDGTKDMTASLANTHVVSHAGQDPRARGRPLPVDRVARTSTPSALHDFGGKLKTRDDRAPAHLPGDRRAALLRLRRAAAVPDLSPRRQGRHARPERGDHRQGPDDDARLERDPELRRVHGPADDLRPRDAREGRHPDPLERRLRRAARRDAAQRQRQGRGLVRDRPLLRLPPDERVRGGRHDRARRGALPEAGVRRAGRRRHAGGAAPLGDRPQGGEGARAAARRPRRRLPARGRREDRPEAPLRLHDGRSAATAWPSSAASS